MNWYIKISQQKAPSTNQLNVVPMGDKNQPQVFDTSLNDANYVLPEDESQIRFDVSYITNVMNQSGLPEYQEIYNNMKYHIDKGGSKPTEMYYNPNLIIDESQLSPWLKKRVTDINNANKENKDGPGVFELSRDVWNMMTLNQGQLPMSSPQSR